MASFFSNNVDYFLASLSYGPRTASRFISPPAAECMLQYKKRAAAYMKALRKVRELLGLCPAGSWELSRPSTVHAV